jgi:ABC-type multidrug transport system fused ATPase/permease subunit
MEEQSIKKLFDKYILIWIWSIFVSINTALSYNIFSIYSTGKWGALTIVFFPLFILAALLALTSWLSLFRFFTVRILELILPEASVLHSENSPEIQAIRIKISKIQEEIYETEYENRLLIHDLEEKLDKLRFEEKNCLFKTREQQSMIAFKHLKNSFYYIILAIATRFIISIIEMGFNIFYN